MWNTVGPSLRTLWNTKMCKRDQSLLWGKTVLFLFSTNTGGWDAWRGGGRGPWRGLLFNRWSSSSSQINLSSFQKHPKTSTKVLPKRKTSVFAELPAGNKILLREPYVLHHKHDAEPCKDAGVLAGLPFTDWSPEQTVLYKSQGRVHALCLCLMLSACWLMPAGPFLFHFVVLTLTVPGERHAILSLGILGSVYLLRHVRDCGFRVLCSGTQADLHIMSLCESAKLSFLSLQIFVEMTNFEPVEHEFKFSATMWAINSECLYGALEK